MRHLAANGTFGLKSELKAREDYRATISKKYGWPLRINARGFTAYLVDVQPLTEGRIAPIYRFPGGDSLVSEGELIPAE